MFCIDLRARGDVLSNVRSLQSIKRHMLLISKPDKIIFVSLT